MRVKRFEAKKNREKVVVVLENWYQVKEGWKFGVYHQLNLDLLPSGVIFGTKQGEYYSETGSDVYQRSIAVVNGRLFEYSHWKKGYVPCDDDALIRKMVRKGLEALS